VPAPHHLAAAMVDEFILKHKNTDKKQLLASNFDTNHSLW
jgi:hypothetical protein